MKSQQQQIYLKILSHDDDVLFCEYECSHVWIETREIERKHDHPEFSCRRMDYCED